MLETASLQNGASQLCSCICSVSLGLSLSPSITGGDCAAAPGVLLRRCCTGLCCSWQSSDFGGVLSSCADSFCRPCLRPRGKVASPLSAQQHVHLLHLKLYVGGRGDFVPGPPPSVSVLHQCLLLQCYQAQG